MSLDSHIGSLQRKHSDLENDLRAAMASPSTTDTEIAEIKRRKLRIKDEIAVLSRHTTH